MNVMHSGLGDAAQPMKLDEMRIQSSAAQLRADHGSQAIEILSRLMSIARTGQDVRELDRLSRVFRVLVASGERDHGPEVPC
jgi:hypothetical protein